MREIDFEYCGERSSFPQFPNDRGGNLVTILFGITPGHSMTLNSESIIVTTCLENDSKNYIEIRYGRGEVIDLPMKNERKGTIYENTFPQDLVKAHFLVIECLRRKRLPQEEDVKQMITDPNYKIDL